MVIIGTIGIIFRLYVVTVAIATVTFLLNDVVHSITKGLNGQNLSLINPPPS